MMTLEQQIITIGKPTPKYIQYLGKVIPGAIFGLLVVYALRNTDILTGSHGLPEVIAMGIIIPVHVWRRNMGSGSRDKR